jgi:tetratricopeptide (TPR) repeat protein
VKKLTLLLLVISVFSCAREDNVIGIVREQEIYNERKVSVSVNATELLKQANLEYENQNYDKAVELFDKILEEDYFNIDARLGKIRVLSSAGNKGIVEYYIRDIWYELSTKEQMEVVSKSLVELYKKTYDFDLAQDWLDVYKCYSNEDEYIRESEQVIKRYRERYINIYTGYEKLRDGESGREYPWFTLFIKSLLPANTRNIPFFAFGALAEIEGALLQIVRWETISEDVILIEGFEPHNATNTAILIFDLNSRTGIIVVLAGNGKVCYFSKDKNFRHAYASIIDEWVEGYEGNDYVEFEFYEN